ncbi:DUF3298 domain-containing protein [Lonepinella sp. BR2930]|uniref:RsiV family protein n=1 Tax=Lonepinella sp. BR2930 TaxID=3434554 RepID=UPI003F6E0418
MKKSLITLLIASTLLLSACEDKEMQTKLQTAEQTISQLNADLEKSQSELKAIQEGANKYQTEIPTLNVKPVTLFEKKQEFKRDPKTTKEEYDIDITDSYIDYHLSTVETGYAWLDDLLYNEMIGQPELEDKQKLQEINAISSAKQRLLKLFDSYYQEGLTSSQSFESFGNELSLSMNYAGQRQNILTFYQTTYIFSGGAHGNGWTHYINIDSNKKSIISLDDLVAKQNQDKLKELLWGSYAEHNQTADESSFYTNKQDFYVSTEFYFTPEGVSFVYPPYAIGPFAEGEITLQVYWQQLEDIVNPSYLW